MTMKATCIPFASIFPAFVENDCRDNRSSQSMLRRGEFRGRLPKARSALR
jgi:hypothetical protein